MGLEKRKNAIELATFIQQSGFGSQLVITSELFRFGALSLGRLGIESQQE